jgi:hypothetical protein
VTYTLARNVPKIVSASTAAPPSAQWAQPHEQMDPDPVVLCFSPEEWNKVASGLVLSPNDLSVIEGRLGTLGKSSNPIIGN